MEQHWLVRPKTIRTLWVVLYVLLALSLLLQLATHVHGKFGIDESFGFNAWFGLGVCAIMVGVARILGVLIKRKDSYYD